MRVLGWLALAAILGVVGCSAPSAPPDAGCPAGACTTNPGAPCFAGVRTCGGCVDSTKRPAGTSCGSGRVCNAMGQCIACNAGEACNGNTGYPCKAGIIECASGVVVCADDLPLTAGTTCGADQVCDGVGRCVNCVEGQACTTNRGAPCMEGAVGCATGGPVCNDARPAPAGTSCGFTSVCDGDGGCGLCTSGASCGTNPGAPCTFGSMDCTQGTPRCLDSARKADAGTTCGLNQVCSAAGACVACAAGVACTGNPNPCKVGTSSCATGAQTCVDSAANVLNGVPCGGGRVCIGGTCGTCTRHSDCGAAANCVAGACVGLGASCAALKTTFPTLGDGEYVLDGGTPDAGAPVLTYCDMTVRSPLCAVDATPQLRRGRMRDGSALDYEIRATLLEASGECEFYALRHPTTLHPFDPSGGTTPLCVAMGFKADSAPMQACNFGASNPNTDCGFPGEAAGGYYRYGYSCMGCTTGNGDFTVFTLQGPMNSANVMTDFTGTKVARCRTR